MATVAIVPLIELALPTVISNYSRYGPGIEITNQAASPLVAGVWAVANRAQFYQITLPANFTVRSLRWTSGTSVSGNYDIGIYDKNFSLLRSSGSTPHPGSTLFQEIPITPLSLTPGNYWLAFAADDAAFGIFGRGSPSSAVVFTAPIRDQLASFPLPLSLDPTGTSHGNYVVLSIASEII